MPHIPLRCTPSIPSSILLRCTSVNSVIRPVSLYAIHSVIRKTAPARAALSAPNPFRHVQKESICVYTVLPSFCSDFIREIFLTIISPLGGVICFQFPVIFRISVICGVNFFVS